MTMILAAAVVLMVSVVMTLVIRQTAIDAERHAERAEAAAARAEASTRPIPWR